MPQQDAIDEFIALPEQQQMSQLKALPKANQDKLLAMVKDRRAQQKAAEPPAPAPTPSFAQQHPYLWDPAKAISERPDVQAFGERHPVLRYFGRMFSPTNVPGPRQTLAETGGILQGAYEGLQGLAGMPGFVFHAMTDPTTEAEKAEPGYSPTDSPYLQWPLRTLNRLTLNQQADLDRKSHETFNQAAEALRAGKPGQAAQHLSDAMAYKATSYVPFMGPYAAHIAERAASGDIAGAVGEAGTTIFGPEYFKRKIEGFQGAGGRFGAVGRALAKATPTDMEVPKAKEFAKEKVETEQARAAAREQAAKTNQYRYGVTHGENVDAALARDQAVQEATAEADRKTQESLEAHNKAVADAKAEAAQRTIDAQNEYDRKVEENRIAADKATALARAGTAAAITGRREAAQQASLAETTKRAVTEGSVKLGERVDEFDDKMKSEIDQKFDNVRAKVEGDPVTGEGATPDMGAEMARRGRIWKWTDEEGADIGKFRSLVNHLETDVLKGSAENIKQFRDVIRRYDLIEGGAKLDKQGKPREEPAPTHFNFGNVRGYSEEVGNYLDRHSNLHSDVWNALTQFKAATDEAAMEMAERHGAAEDLRDAKQSYFNWRQVLHDKGGALAAVRDAVGKKNRAAAFQELMRGNKDEVAMEQLGRLKTTNKADAIALIKLIQQLKQAASAGKAPAVPGRPEPPTITTPEPVAMPQRFFPPTVGLGAHEIPPPEVFQPGEVPPTQFKTVDLAPIKNIEGPTWQSVQDWINQRRDRVASFYRGWITGNRWDVARAATGGAFGVFRGNVASAIFGALAAGIGPKVVGLLMSSDTVVNMIAAPGPWMLEAADHLPEPERSYWIENVNAIIQTRAAQGRPINVPPATRQWLGRFAPQGINPMTGLRGAANIPPAPVQNRADALERLGRNPAQPSAPAAAAAAPARSTPSMTLDEFNVQLDRLLPPGDPRFTDANRKYSVMAGDAPVSELGNILERARAEQQMIIQR
jgi:hypothetical protein